MDFDLTTSSWERPIFPFFSISAYPWTSAYWLFHEEHFFLWRAGKKADPWLFSLGDLPITGRLLGSIACQWLGKWARFWTKRCRSKTKRNLYLFKHALNELPTLSALNSVERHGVRKLLIHLMLRKRSPSTKCKLFLYICGWNVIVFAVKNILI